MEVYDLDSIVGTREYGGVVKIVVNQDISSDLISGVFLLAPGEALVPDIHDSDEVFYVISGELTLRDEKGQESHKIKRGQMARIPKGQTHLSSNEGREDVHIFWAFART
jgi:mannose-6-phosphate isomerase-like protein (cupin superfamily)